MCDVQITTEDDRLRFGKAGQVLAEDGIPMEPVGKAAEPILGVDSVDVDKVKIRILEGDDTAFLIVIRDSKTVCARDGFMPGEDRRAGVAGFVRGVPVRSVTSECQRQLYLFLASLGFLEAEDVGIFA